MAKIMIDIKELSENDQQIEVEQDPTVVLLSDIKEILSQMSKDMLQITQGNQSQGVEMYKSQEDELISRSFRIYHNINERLKIATKGSEMNQQQLFNALLDKGLKELGY